MKKRREKHLRLFGKIMFILYVLFLIYFLFFAEWYGRSGETGEYRYNLVLFQEIKRFWEYKEQLGWISAANLLGNVAIFVPFGFFMPMASRYRSFSLTTVYSFGLSLIVECFQLIFQVGTFDVDDLLLNTIGGAIGYIVFVIFMLIRGKKDAVRKK